MLLEGYLDRDFVGAESVLFFVVLYCESVVQEETVVALLTVAVVDLVAAADALEGSYGEALAIVIESPFCFSGSALF